MAHPLTHAQYITHHPLITHTSKRAERKWYTLHAYIPIYSRTQHLEQSEPQTEALLMQFANETECYKKHCAACASTKTAICSTEYACSPGGACLFGKCVHSQTKCRSLSLRKLRATSSDEFHLWWYRITHIHSALHSVRESECSIIVRKRAGHFVCTSRQMHASHTSLSGHLLALLCPLNAAHDTTKPQREIPVKRSQSVSNAAALIRNHIYRRCGLRNVHLFLSVTEFHSPHSIALWHCSMPLREGHLDRVQQRPNVAIGPIEDGQRSVVPADA